MAATPVKQFDIQVAMSTHVSQSTGPCDGQHGISLAISSVTVVGDFSSVIACVETRDDSPAMTGCESGPKTSPAIKTTARRRLMAIWWFTPLESHGMGQIDSLPRLTTP